jgi:hypothetical protein
MITLNAPTNHTIEYADQTGEETYLIVGFSTYENEKALPLKFRWKMEVNLKFGHCRLLLLQNMLSYQFDQGEFLVEVGFYCKKNRLNFISGVYPSYIDTFNEEDLSKTILKAIKYKYKR